MNQSGPNQEELRRMAQQMEKQGGMSPGEVQKAVQNGRVEDLLGKLSKEDANRVRDLMNDRQKTQALLSSPAAQALLRKLMGK